MKKCNWIDVIKRSKKLFPTHIILFVNVLEHDKIDKTNQELKKLIPKNWEHKEIETGLIGTEKKTKSLGIFSSSSTIIPKFEKRFRHFIYRRIGESNVKDLFAELNGIYNFLICNESGFSCSSYNVYGYLRFYLKFGFDINVHKLKEELWKSVDLKPNMVVRNSELEIKGSGKSEIDSHVMVPFQVQVIHYGEYEFYVKQTIGYVFSDSKNRNFSK